MKGLKDLASALATLPMKVPHEINHINNNDANQWFRKPLRKFQKETTRTTSLYIGVLTGTHYNGYSLDFFGSCRYVCMSRFHWERNTTFWMKLRSNCDSFDDGIVDMLSSLASQYGSYKEKERSRKFGKRPQYCWI